MLSNIIFYGFCSFWSAAVKIMCKLQLLYLYLQFYCQIWVRCHSTPLLSFGNLTFFFKMAIFGHLESLTFKFLMADKVQRASEHRRAKISCRSVKPLGRDGYFSMRSIVILDLLLANLGHMWRVFSGLYVCALFVCNRIYVVDSNFDNTQVLICRMFGLKTPIHAQNGYFWFK